jgi:anti-sigma factor RsiW
MSACADKELLLHGMLDGELDAVNALACEAHLRVCEACAAELERLRALRERLRAPGVSYPAPAALRAAVMAQLAPEQPLTAAAGIAASGMAPASTAAAANEAAGVVARGRRGPRRPALRAFWPLAAAALAALAVGMWLLWSALSYSGSGALSAQLLASHKRSLLPDHLTDVAVSDQHLVKPWFNGRVDFAPPVPDLGDAGFTLAGGRLDYINNRVVAVVVYHRRLHVINVFIWPGAAPRLAPQRVSRRDGYGLMHWQSGDLQFWAVSDVDNAELQRFQAAFVQHLEAEPAR